MNDNTSIHDRIAIWLGEEAESVAMPERVVRRTVDRTRTMRQVWTPGVWPAMPRARFLAMAATVAALALVGLLGAALIGRLIVTENPTPNPSPSLEASSSLQASPIAAYPTSIIDPVTGLPGRIVFAREYGGQSDIWLMAPDRTGLVQLTTDPAVDRMPVWSPDGTRILFARASGEDSSLWMMNADGSNQVRVAGEPGKQLAEPVWSADGSTIAFTQAAPFGPEGGEGIYVMNPDGSNVRPVLIFGQHGVRFPHKPALSPDGRTVVVSGEADLFLIGVDGKSFRQLTNTPQEDAAGAWSPDGQWIAFQGDASGGCIWRIHPDGTGLERLTNGCSQDVSMSYSPDGGLLARAGGSHGPDDLWVMDADGASPRQLTDTRDITEISWGP